jgi:hypothetical protein
MRVIYTAFRLFVRRTGRPHEWSVLGSMRTRSRFVLPGSITDTVDPHAQGKLSSPWVSFDGFADDPTTRHPRPQRSHRTGRSNSVIVAPGDCA